MQSCHSFVILSLSALHHYSASIVPLLWLTSLSILVSFLMNLSIIFLSPDKLLFITDFSFHDPLVSDFLNYNDDPVQHINYSAHIKNHTLTISLSFPKLLLSTNLSNSVLSISDHYLFIANLEMVKPFPCSHLFSIFMSHQVCWLSGRHQLRTGFKPSLTSFDDHLSCCTIFRQLDTYVSVITKVNTIIHFFTSRHSTFTDALNKDASLPLNPWLRQNLSVENAINLLPLPGRDILHLIIPDYQIQAVKISLLAYIPPYFLLLLPMRSAQSSVIIFCLFAFTLQSLLDSHSHLPVPETPVPLTSSVSPGLLSLAVMCLSFLRVSELSLSSHHPLPQATYVYDCNFFAVNWKPLQRPCPVWNLGLFWRIQPDCRRSSVSCGCSGQVHPGCNPLKAESLQFHWRWYCLSFLCWNFHYNESWLCRKNGTSGKSQSTLQVTHCLKITWCFCLNFLFSWVNLGMSLMITEAECQPQYKHNMIMWIIAYIFLFSTK